MPAKLGSFIDQCIIDPNNRVTASFKKSPKDFIVHENLDWDFSGTGEHLFLQIKKENQTTIDIAKILARFYSIPIKDIGYAGLKDKNAITTQFFSVRLPTQNKKNIPNHFDFEVLNHYIHHRKLKRRFHQSNQFIITLHDLSISPEQLDHKIKQIQQQGVPNFFDEQRFGYQQKNIDRLVAFANGSIKIKSKHEKSLLLSTLRACIFNEILAYRVKEKTWNQALLGDLMQLEKTQSYFGITQIDDELEKRLLLQDIHPTGLMVGFDSHFENTDREQIEASIFNQYQTLLMPILKKYRLQTTRRSLRMKVNQLSYELKDNQLTLKFSLLPGCYASAVIKQLVRPI